MTDVPEYERGSTGPESARVSIENAIGKTIDHIWFGPDPSIYPDVHQGERLVLHFTDGTNLEIMIGSNLGAETFRKGLRAPEARLSFIPLFHEETRPED